MTAQTAVFQEQLGAAVWPYISVSEGVTNDTAQITVSNDGLGPAVIGSMVARVDGVSQPSYAALLHAVLGKHLIARSKGSHIGFSVDTGQPGGVIRPGERGLGFSMMSKHFAPQLLKASGRLTFRICYCAIIPGKCWISDSSTSKAPAATSSCPAIPNDLLHTPGIDLLTDRSI